MSHTMMSSALAPPMPSVRAETEVRTAAPYSNPYVAGIGLGLVLLAAFVTMGRGLGASGAVSATVAGLLNMIAPDHAQSREWLAGYFGDGANPFKEWLVFEGLGVVAGALLSGLLANRAMVIIERGPRISRGTRLLLAFAGGTMTAFGAALARGCTSGQALTGGSLLNLGSWAFMLMVFAGAYGLAYFVKREWR